MTVPVIRDFWSAYVLVTSMVFFMWKHGRGNTVGLRVSSWGENLMLRRWMYGFGVSHTLLWFDEIKECGGAKSMKTVSFGMFAWAVRCEILGEADLCTNSERVRALLYQLVGICHGPGLVDVTVTAYIKCAICFICVCL